MFSFEPDGQLKNEIFDNNHTLSMKDCYLDCFRKTVNIRNFYDNGGGYVRQSNDTVREFHLHLSYPKLENAATTPDHIYTLLARMFEKNIVRDGTMWDQTDVCAKKYSYSIAQYLMYFL